jgi:hypothetical protein
MKVTEIRTKKFELPSETEKAKSKELMEKMRKEQSKLVKGMFEFVDAQGGWLDFTYRFFPGEPIMQFHFVHGEICDVPLGIVKHLNNIVKKVRQMPTELPSGKKATEVSPVQKISRVRFTPMDMM